VADPFGQSGQCLRRGGLQRVLVYSRPGKRAGPRRKGRGFFAQALLAANPLLPIEEERQLKDPRLRENFLRSVFAYHRLKSFFRGRWTRTVIQTFHASQQFVLFAHSPECYRRLRRLIAQAKDLSRSELRARYAAEFMAALSRCATARRDASGLEQIVREQTEPESPSREQGAGSSKRRGARLRARHSITPARRDAASAAMPSTRRIASRISRAKAARRAKRSGVPGSRRPRLRASRRAVSKRTRETDSAL